MNDKSTGKKSVNAFRTISEVATRLGVPKHVLRFWEGKFPQVKPMKRGGGRRYYRPEDIDLLQGIRTLLHSDGYTIKGVQKILREQGVQYVKDRGEPAVGSDAQVISDDAREKISSKDAGKTSGRAKRKGAKSGLSSGKSHQETSPRGKEGAASGAKNKGALIEAPAGSRSMNEVQRDALKAIIDQLGECRVMLRGYTGESKAPEQPKSASAAQARKRA